MCGFGLPTADYLIRSFVYGSGQGVITIESGAPLPNREIGRNDHRSLLIALRNDLEG